MTYRYKCKNCGHKFDWHNVDMEKRDEFHPPCPECESEDNKRIIPDRFTFVVTETNDVVSAKPDSYWANAEANRQKAAKKRDEEKKEKWHYDEKYREKKITNKQRAAKLGEEGIVVNAKTGSN